MRFKLIDVPEASLTLLLDAVVQPHGKDEWIAISREPANVGETLMLDMVVDEQGDCELRQRFPVCVIDCSPVIIDGDLRHRIRLRGGDPALVLFEQHNRRG